MFTDQSGQQYHHYVQHLELRVHVPQACQDPSCSDAGGGHVSQDLRAPRLISRLLRKHLQLPYGDLHTPEGLGRPELYDK